MKKKLFQIDERTWVHYSQGQKKTKLRWFADDHADEEFLNGRDDQKLTAVLKGATEVSMAEAYARIADIDPDLNPTELPIERREDWQRVFELLRKSKAYGRSDAPRIPQTWLRRFYQSLRLFSSNAIHAAFADYLADGNRDTCAEHLQAIFKNSCVHFAQYENIEESFHPKRTTDPWWGKYANGASDMAKMVIARLKCAADSKSAVSVTRNGKYPDLDFIPIDYEVSPLRTTGGRQFESGTLGKESGAGGCDLLLQHAIDKLPIIGEVKAPGDTNLFLALVQVLTYVVEFSTPSQKKRLSRFYPGMKFSRNDKCDVYLIYFKGKEPELKRQTTTIADRLLSRPDNPVSQAIRRVAFLEADLGEEGVSFRCTHLSKV